MVMSRDVFGPSRSCSRAMRYTSPRRNLMQTAFGVGGRSSCPNTSSAASILARSALSVARCTDLRSMSCAMSARLRSKPDIVRSYPSIRKNSGINAFRVYCVWCVCYLMPKRCAPSICAPDSSAFLKLPSRKSALRRLARRRSSR